MKIEFDEMDKGLLDKIRLVGPEDGGKIHSIQFEITDPENAAMFMNYLWNQNNAAKVGIKVLEYGFNPISGASRKLLKEKLIEAIDQVFDGGTL